MIEGNNEIWWEIYKGFLAQKEIECRETFYEFVKYMWDTVCAEKYVDNFHIEYICKRLQFAGKRIIKRQPVKKHLIINISPGESKTIIISQMFCAWLWTHDASLRFLGSSHSDGLSTTNSMFTKDIVMSEKYKDTFGEIGLKSDMAGKSDFMTVIGGRRKATSVQSNITGSHFHVIAFDDLVDANEETSLADLQKVNNHIDKCLSRKVDEAITFVCLIMQRVAYNDPTTYLYNKLKHQGCEIISIPAEDIYPVKPESLKQFYKDGVMNPVRKPREVLDRLKKQMLGKYAIQYGQNPLEKKGKSVKAKDFIKVEKIDLDSSFFIAKNKLCSDTAYTESEKNDPSGFLICKYYKNILYLVDYYEERYELPEAVEFMAELTDRFGVDLSYIENKASGTSIAQTCRKIKALNVADFNPGIKNKEQRFADYAVPMIKGGRVHIIVTPDNKERMEYFLLCCTQFPEKTIRDEAVDCLSMACKLSEGYIVRDWQT